MKTLLWDARSSLTNLGAEIPKQVAGADYKTWFWEWTMHPGGEMTRDYTGWAMDPGEPTTEC